MQHLRSGIARPLLHKKNVVYKITCGLCDETPSVYIGESKRRVRERFNEHIRDATLQTRSLQGVRGGYSKGGVIAAYYANVRSILEYGSVVWAGTASSHLDRLERIQHNFLWFLAGTRRDRFDMCDYEGLCASYKIDTLVKRRTALNLSFYTVSCQGESRAHCC